MNKPDEVVIDYNYRGESPYNLLLDSFVSKPFDIDELVKEIKRFV